MRYFRRIGQGYRGHDDSWGDPTYWLEVNAQGDAERQLEEYPNGNMLSYDRTHEEDQYGGLGIMVIDGDEDLWAPYEISHDEFEQKWRSQNTMNRQARTGAAEGQSS